MWLMSWSQLSYTYCVHVPKCHPPPVFILFLISSCFGFIGKVAMNEFVFATFNDSYLMGWCNNTYQWYHWESNNWPLLWAGQSTEGCLRGRHTRQSDLMLFFQWVTIWWEEEQWGSGRRERGEGGERGMGNTRTEHFTCYIRAYGKAGNGNETEIGNGNLKWDQRTH